jgi:YesN/AraC family two-component response regulator
MIRTTEYSDLQRLELYLDQHYMEKLSLASISNSLEISRTKLCSMAKRLSGGKTLSRMIAERRVAAAKVLLIKSDRPISEIAESVGITDYNYFTKIFRSVAGMTPRAFRSQHRHNGKFTSF